MTAVSPAYLWNDTARINHIPSITVKGRVTEITPSKKYRSYKYVRITEDNCTVSALLKDMVRVDDYVLVKGEPRHSNRREIGSVIDLYHSKLISREPRIEEIQREKPRVNLAQFVDQHDVSKLLVVGTPRGLRDYRAAITRAGLSVSWLELTPSFGRADSLLEAINNHPRKNDIQAIAYLRGGGKDKNADIFDSPDFVGRLIKSRYYCYIAVGHDDTEHLADRCFDQSLSTPTHFGDALSHAIKTAKTTTNIHSRKSYIPSSFENPPPRRKFQMQSLKPKVISNFSRLSPIRYCLDKGKTVFKKILKWLFLVVVTGSVLCTIGLILLFTFF